MNRGFVGALFTLVVVVAIIGGIAWWALSQNSSVPTQSTSSVQTQIIPGIFTYSANKSNQYEFPFGIFQIIGDTLILGANYVHVRNTSTAVYTLLGADAGTPLAASCHWVVRASIEIANATLDTFSYADVSPTPTVAVADLVRVVSHDRPQQVCATP